MECSICGNPSTVLHQYDDLVNPLCDECNAVEKKWRPFPDSDCSECGGSLEIYTLTKLPEGYGFDADPLRCSSCGGTGQLNCDGEYANAECPAYD